jgi:hypothetical protein
MGFLEVKHHEGQFWNLFIANVASALQLHRLEAKQVKWCRGTSTNCWVVYSLLLTVVTGQTSSKILGAVDRTMLHMLGGTNNGFILAFVSRRPYSPRDLEFRALFCP